LARGAAVRTALLQPERDPIPAPEQLTVLLAAMNGHLDKVPAAQMPATMVALRGAARSGLGAVAERIMTGAPLEEGDRAAILDLASRALTEAGVDADA
jgi:F-type H+-transporting ATPase subunit alpha